MMSFSLCQRWYSHKTFLQCFEATKPILDFIQRSLVLLYQSAIEPILRMLLIFSRKNRQAETCLRWVKETSGAYLNLEWVMFIREFIRSPRTIGAIYPSSGKLARCMAEEVIVNENDLVVELGAGTGRVTEALLRRGLPPDRLIVVERSHELAATLRKRFPLVDVIEGDAADLLLLLRRYNVDDIQYVVSGLPFRTLLPSAADAITKQVIQLMNDNARFIQFTYSLHNRQPGCFADFRLIRSLIVWPNIPPACVNVFIKGD